MECDFIATLEKDPVLDSQPFAGSQDHTPSSPNIELWRHSIGVARTTQERRKHHIDEPANGLAIGRNLDIFESAAGLPLFRTYDVVAPVSCDDMN